jgi:hypothetical protein
VSGCARWNPRYRAGREGRFGPGSAGRAGQPTVDPDSTFPRSFPGWVRLRLHDGRQLEARTPDGQGSLARPLPPGAIVDKFRDNAGRAGPSASVGEIERLVLRLDTLPDVRALSALCRA